MTRHSTAFWVLLGAPLLLLTNGCSSDFSDCSELRACPNAEAAGIAGAAGSTGGANFAGQSGTSEGSSATSAAQAGAAGVSNDAGGIGSGGASDSSAGDSSAGDSSAGDSSAGAGGVGAAGAGGTAATSGGTGGSGGSVGKAPTGGGAGSSANPPLTVMSVTPANDATAVDPNVQPTIRFSEALDLTTVTPSSLKLMTGTSAVPGAITFSGTNALFSPSSPLDLLGTYTVSATTDLKDTDGASLLTAFSSSFTVRDGVWGAAKDLGVIATNSDPVVAVDGAGNALFVWVDSTFHIIFTRWYRGGRWGESLALTDGTGYVGRPLVAVNAKGDALVAFTDEFILYTRQYRNGAWDTPSPAMDLDCDEPSIGLSPAGVAHVICDGLTALIARHSDTHGNWAANATAIVNGSTFSSVSFAFSSNDDAIATWRSSDLFGNVFRSNVQTARFASSQWGEATIVPGSQVEPPDEAGAPAIASDTSANTMVAWAHSTGPIMGVQGSRQLASGVWSTPVEVSSATGMIPIGAPALVSDGKDFILAWNQMNGAQWTTYQARNVAGVWQEATTPQAHRAVVPSGDRMPSLGVDSRGNLVILWVEAGPTTAGRFIEASRYVRATSTWSSPTRLNTFGNTTTTATLAVGASGRAAVVYANNAVAEFYANIFE